MFIKLLILFLGPKDELLTDAAIQLHPKFVFSDHSTIGIIYKSGGK